ncbi:MAG: hypothetical protein NT086_12435 [Proteobacteria bacterium]|nr:hypothetical protein [Pseudomonadota bacterium]
MSFFDDLGDFGSSISDALSGVFGGDNSDEDHPNYSGPSWTSTGSSILSSMWGVARDGAKNIGETYSGMDSSTKGILASIVAGGGQAYLQSRAQDNQIEAQRAMSREQWDRTQQARQIPDAIKAEINAGRFK